LVVGVGGRGELVLEVLGQLDEQAEGEGLVLEAAALDVLVEHLESPAQAVVVAVLDLVGLPISHTLYLFSILPIYTQLLPILSWILSNSAYSWSLQRLTFTPFLTELVPNPSFVDIKLPSFWLFKGLMV
jgi:hypothetical protein